MSENPELQSMNDGHRSPVPLSRRRILQVVSAAGIGSATLHRALAQEATQTGTLTVDQIANAEWVAGITLSEAERAALSSHLQKIQRDAEQIRRISIESDIIPAIRFDPEIGTPDSRVRSAKMPDWLTVPADLTPAIQPADAAPENLAFLPIRELGRRLRAKEITSVQLTEFCLARLKKHDPVLNCVVTLTEDLGLEQARRADAELAAGRDRGPLHGIPWGAKDLIAVSGYATTWGAPQFKDQHIRQTAAVARRLENAGAVLVAKLALGALAMGDEWFLGQTKNPWNPEQGSSGSSAGSASAVAAGLVPFAIGSETLGSIISPAKRCGVTGLRPTFGRVSRAGCMTLSWTMDKLGPLARTVDDCGTVLSAIQGSDPADPTSVDRWYAWPVAADLSRLRIGQVTNAHTEEAEQAALDALKALGATIVPIELPHAYPEWALSAMLDVEAAESFHRLSATNDLEGINAWGDIFRRAHFVSAIDFLHAQRARFQLMVEMARVFEQADLYVGGGDLGITNLTGHPMIALPVLMKEMKPQSRAICGTLTGNLYDEASLLAVARQIEAHVDVAKFQPTLFSE